MVVWKTIPGYPGYEASSDGRVRSVDREVNVLRKGVAHIRKRKGQELAQYTPEGDPYPRVTLGYDTFKVHIIVCTIFHGPPPEDKPLCLHRDDVPSNNREDNLYWGDLLDNKADCRANGHDTQRTSDVVRANIRDQYALGVTRRTLAHNFQLDRSTVFRITQDMD